MHIHFVGIGGAGIGPLAQIAQQAGYSVSGSDLQSSQYVDYLAAQGITNIKIGQSEELVSAIHQSEPIDWLVYSSAVTIVDKNPPILDFCRRNGIKFTKRDEFINKLITDHNLKMIAVAGTHGKTTTTAMLVWLFKEYNEPLSYLLPAKVNYGEMGNFDTSSNFFVYEADEFDRNFLAFSPYISVITGVSWDHHEIYPTQDDYKKAFIDFINKSNQTVVWGNDASYLGLTASEQITVLNQNDEAIEQLNLKGQYNRYDAWLSLQTVNKVLGKTVTESLPIIDKFPGLSRRMEELVPGLYSDYAHTPDKVRGGMSAALEIASDKNQSVVVIYEPLTNRRQLHMLKQYKDSFKGAKKVYWLPSYLAREDPSERIIEPEELISNLDDPSIAVPAKLDDDLKTAIKNHLANGDMVVGMAGGGGNSLDDWLREQFKT